MSRAKPASTGAKDLIITPTGGEPIEATQRNSISYEAELKAIWDVDYNQSPYAQFEAALKTGSVIVHEQGQNIKVKISAFECHLVDQNTGLKFKQSLNLREAKAVFVHGKDKEVFREAFQTCYTEHHKRIQEQRELLSPSRDEHGNEIVQEDFSNRPMNQNLTGPDSGNMDTEYLPLGNGPMNQQLMLSDQWAMLAKAFEAYQHNPYAHRAVHIIVNFVLGRGFEVNLADEQLNDEWDVMAKDLKLGKEVYTWMRDLERQGELFLRPIYNPITGDITDIINIEASTILEVITDPENVNKVYGYWQQYMTPIQIYGPGAEKSAKFVIHLYDADEIIHIKINNAGAEKRGRSTFFPGLEYLKMVRDYHVANANRAIAEACLVMDWTIDGTPGDVQSFASSVSPVNYKHPISSIYHSKAVSVQAVNMSGSKGNSRDIALDAMISAVALTFGISKDYLGAINTQTRAGSLVTTEPSVKHFEQRQLVLGDEILYQLIQGWIDRRILSGAVPLTRMASTKSKLKMSLSMLKQGKLTDAMTQLWSTVKGTPQEIPLNRNIHVRFPELVKGDLSVMIDNAAKMQSMGWWSARRAATLATQEWGGIDTYDFDEEQDEIKTLGTRPIAAQFAQVPSIDPSNPVDPSLMADNNATDSPPPHKGGVQSKSQHGLNMRNNPHGVGAPHLKKAIGANK